MGRTSSLAWLLLIVLQLLKRTEALVSYACEANRLVLDCNNPYSYGSSPPTVLLIRKATFGRRMGPDQRCGDVYSLRNPCEADATSLVKYHCQGHTYCRVFVDIATFRGGPFNHESFCVDIRKYLEVEYDCVPSATMTQLTTCTQSCLPAAPAPRYPSAIDGGGGFWSSQYPYPAQGSYPTYNSGFNRGQVNNAIAGYKPHQPYPPQQYHHQQRQPQPPTQAAAPAAAKQPSLGNRPSPSKASTSSVAKQAPSPPSTSNRSPNASGAKTGNVLSNQLQSALLARMRQWLLASQNRNALG